MKLRSYQKIAVEEALSAIRAGLSPVVQMPTGSGKSMVGAEICRQLAEDAGNRSASVLSITHTRELIRQNAECFGRWCDTPSAIYSAGLDEKRLDAPVIFAGVQSYCRVENPPQPDAMLVDEAHRIPGDAETQYGSVIGGSPDAALIGLTATPYRLSGGLLADGPWFDTLIEPVSTADLQASGYLSPLTGVVSRDAIDVTGVHVRAGEFVNGELEQVATDDACVDRVCRSIIAHSAGRRSILVFAVSVAHAESLSRRLCELGERADYIHGGMAMDERDNALQAFSGCRTRFLANCAILTTGYDYPGIDCIACVRPTQSMGLWVQMIGRALRKAEGKADALILDYGGNWARHGRSLDGLPEERIADEPEQDRQRRIERAKNQDQKLYRFALDDGRAGPGHDEVAVYGIKCEVQRNRKKPDLSQLMLTYSTAIGTIRIWLLPEHDRGARWHSERWFGRRGLQMPRVAAAAKKLVDHAPVPESISVAKDGSFWRIRTEHFLP